MEAQIDYPPFASVEEALEEVRAGRPVIVVDDEDGENEASVDLARLAGLVPAGVVCEIMKDDGTMARVPDLAVFCRRHGLKMITVASLIEYRRQKDRLVEQLTSVQLPTAYGRFECVAFREVLTGKHHLALVKGDVAGPVDAREYGIGSQILADLGLTSIRILTNNPKKIVGLESFGLRVVAQEPIEVPPNAENAEYLQTKRDRMGHLLQLHHQDLRFEDD